jgi:hypothetical protein
MPKKLNVYFPINNLNPQGWVSEFVTPVINKTGGSKDILSNLFYNNFLRADYPGKAELQNILSNSNFDYDGFIQKRQTVGTKYEEKMIFLNGNYLDLMEVDEKYKGPPILDDDLKKYTLFMSSAKPYQLAFLQPYMKLSYGYRENKKQEFKWIEIPFTQHYDLDYILSEKQHARAEGSGITNVNVSNKFNLGTQVNSEITISFLFGNMNILTREILSNGQPLASGESPYPYGFSFMKLLANLDINTEAIKLEYGRKVSPGFNEVAPKDLGAIIEAKEKKVYLLSKFKHTFSFDEKGMITIDVNYYNFHDVAEFSKNNVSIPSNNPDNNFLYKNISFETSQLLYNYNNAKYVASDLEEKLNIAKKTSETQEISKLESEQRDLRIRDITKKLSSVNKTLNLTKRSLREAFTTVFLDKIRDNGQLFSVNFKTDKVKDSYTIETTINLVEPDDGNFIPIVTDTVNYDINSFKKSPKLLDYYKKTTNADNLLNDIFKRIFNSPYENSKSKTAKYGHIMFFPLKALFAAAYSFLDENEKINEKETIPHMLFGNVLMKVGDSLCSINVGDLLIESGVFQRWYYEKVSKKDRLEYSFGAFIFDVITDLVPEALYRNRVGFDDKAPTSAIKKNQFYLKRPLNEQSDLQLKSDLYVKGDETSLKSLSDLISKTPNNQAIPLIYYGQLNNKTMQVSSPIFSKYGDAEFNFNEFNDADKGIMHIKIGSDGGIVERVDFQHQDFPKIRTALAMESLADKSSRYFFFYYQLGITTLGNNAFAYDSFVCVPSNPLGIDSTTNDPGIAGYYKVKETRDSIDAGGGYTTSATADWAFNPRDQNTETNKIDAPPTARINITDSLPIEINNPINYIIELVETDAISVINQQLQKMNKAQKKASEQAKKNNKPKTKKVNNLDKNELSANKNSNTPLAE